MQIHKLIVSVLDFDQLGADGVKQALENTRFANDCISPSVRAIESRDIGEWSDDSPLNRRDTAQAEFERLFAPTAPPVAAPAASIDTPEFRELLIGYRHALVGYQNENRAALIAHIDAFVAQHGQQKYEAGLEEGREEYRESFRYWKARGHRAEASLARLVEDIHNLPVWSPFNQDVVYLSDLLALLPAKAEVKPQDGYIAYSELTGVAREMADIYITKAEFAAPAMPAKAEAPTFGSTIPDAANISTEERKNELASVLDRFAPATPAPAMGEELPPTKGIIESIDCEEFRKLADAYHCVKEQGDVEPTYAALFAFIDKEIERQAVSYGRACMALRPPGALSDEHIRMLASASGELDGDEADYCFTEVALIAFARHVAAHPAIATAPVSQPAAQEVRFFRQKGSEIWIEANSPLNWLSNPKLAQAFETRTLYTAPQPITEPINARNIIVMGRHNGGPDVELQIVGDGATEGMYMLLVSLPCSPITAPAGSEPTYTADEIGGAAADVGISDSKYEALCVALAAQQKNGRKE